MDIDLLSKMVRELILDNDRVVLPGLGAFVAEFVPSTFSDKGYTINPPYRRLYFRSKPDEGNELAQMYAKGNKVDISVAEKIISDFVTDMKETLHLKKAIAFPGLGRLRATKENNIFFVADEDLNIYPEGFGLEPISLKTHQETPEEVSAAVGDLKSILLEPAAAPVEPVVPVEPAEPVAPAEPSVPSAPAEPVAPAPAPERKIEIEAISEMEVLPADDAVDIILAEKVEEALMKAVEKIQQDKANQEKERLEREREEILRQEREREEALRQEREREERLRQEKERQEREKLEKFRMERDRREMERLEREKLARQEREKREAIRLEMLLQDKDASAKKKSSVRRTVWTTLGIVVAVAALMFAALAILGRTAPDIIDRLLYTQEELNIVNQID